MNLNVLSPAKFYKSSNSSCGCDETELNIIDKNQSLCFLDREASAVALFSFSSFAPQILNLIC